MNLSQCCWARYAVDLQVMANGSQLVRNFGSMLTLVDLVRLLESIAETRDNAFVVRGAALAQALLNDLIGLSVGGHGDFSASVHADGLIEFVGEPDALSELILRLDREKIVEATSGRARVRFISRLNGGVYDTFGLKHALEVLLDTRHRAHEALDVAEWTKREQRLGAPWTRREEEAQDDVF